MVSIAIGDTGGVAGRGPVADGVGMICAGGCSIGAPPAGGAADGGEPGMTVGTMRRRAGVGICTDGFSVMSFACRVGELEMQQLADFFPHANQLMVRFDETGAT
ncbi:MAG: hypothetical protein WC732_08555 [Candidatus Omnitrophota bacterium]